MDRMNLNGFLYGLATYVACLAPAMAPVFNPPLGPHAAERLALAGILASVLVALELLTDFDVKIRDPGAKFTQALLGIAVCAGLYTAVAVSSQPQIMLMSLLWIAIGLNRLSRREVLVLTGLFLGIYLYAYSGALMDAAEPRHGDALYTLMVSILLGAFFYARAQEYHVLHSSGHAQAIALADAEERIHEFTIQDAETTALKPAFFRNQLIKIKNMVDSEGGTFSLGLLEIDRFAEVSQQLGEAATGQLLREFSERTMKLSRSSDCIKRFGDACKPLGRISAGRFGLIFPGKDFEAAMKCAEQLHDALDFQAIRTHAGVVSLTLSIGITEYVKPEGVDEIMDIAARALALAQSHNGNDYKGLRYQGTSPDKKTSHPPERAGTTALIPGGLRHSH